MPYGLRVLGAVTLLAACSSQPSDVASGGAAGAGANGTGAVGGGGGSGGSAGAAGGGGTTGGSGGVDAGGAGGTDAGGAAGSDAGGNGGVATKFDFDTGTPPLSTGQSVPFDQSSGGVTAHFDSPQGAAFSIQTDASTGWKMSQFSGNYLYDNNLNANTLVIGFDRQLVSIGFTFATADFQQVEVPTTIQLTAYQGSATTPVGSTTAHGSYAGDTMPMGSISFAAAAGFDRIEVSIPYQPQGASDFFVDDVAIVTQ